MKVLLMIGSHMRHFYFANKVNKFYEICGAVVEEREDFIPVPPEGLENIDRNNFIRHFDDRKTAEEKFYQNTRSLYLNCPVHSTDYESLNKKDTADFIGRCNPDIVLVFGTGLLKKELLSILPDNVINLHLGLSPWYKGSATLFWPFYFLEPQMAGITFHQIINKIDAGPIISQALPVLEYGDGIHDIGAKSVIVSVNEAVKILDYFKEHQRLPNISQGKKNGKLFLTTDFQPIHLRVIYQTFNNNIVDYYLDGKLSTLKPKLVVI